MNYLILSILILFAQLQASAVEKLVILGSGPAGLTSSLFAAQAHLNPLVIEGDPQEGQISSIYLIENYPGFPDGISGDELAKRIHQQAEKFGARFYASDAISVDLQQRPFYLLLKDGAEIYCESLIIATGASPRRLGVPGEEELFGLGVSGSAVVDGPKYKDKKVVVVGGGDSALEQALILSQYAQEVLLIYKEKQFTGVSYLKERVKNTAKIRCQLETEITAIKGIAEGHVTGAILKNVASQQESLFACDGIFISNGRKPNTDLFIGQLEINEKGYIHTKSHSAVTSIPGVFAAGDITESPYRKVTTAVASGCISALEAIKFLKK